MVRRDLVAVTRGLPYSGFWGGCATVSEAGLLSGAIWLTASSATVPGAVSGPGATVIATFLQNVTRWLQFLASLAAVATVAYGGLRYIVAHDARAQADAWRLILAGIGGLVVALLAPTIVSIVQGMVPS
jgi:type IV secretory pathway VirB2 component (pilin)